MTQALWAETYAVSATGYECPHAPFDPSAGYCYVDSLNFRLPTALAGTGKERLQKNLGPHIDLNPWNKYGGVKGRKRWRPFQGFISLTDGAGGLSVCPGFHTRSLVGQIAVMAFVESFPWP